jgi:hypothetical protein
LEAKPLAVYRLQNFYACGKLPVVLRCRYMSDSERPGDTRRDETLRPGAFYETMNRECGARGWRIRQFSEWLGLDDKLYTWRGKKQPHGLPEAETLIQIAVRLSWPLDRLLRGVSAANDAQADKRREETARALNTGMEHQSTTPTSDGNGGEWAKLHSVVSKPDRPTSETRDQRTALLDLLTPEQWALVRTIIGLGPEEAAQARTLIRRWLGQRDEPASDDASTGTHTNQGGSTPKDRSGNDR